MTIERFHRVAEVLSKRQPDLTVVSDSVHKGQNLSAIVRTCDAVGVMAVHSALDAATFRAHTVPKWAHINGLRPMCIEMYPSP